MLKVREIIKMMDITAVPQVPRARQGRDEPARQGDSGHRPAAQVRLPAGREYTERTCIIVVEVALADRPRDDGHHRRQVSEVLNIAADEIEQTPEFGDRVCTDYMKGVAKVKGTVKILLDLDRVLGTDDAALRAA